MLIAVTIEGLVDGRLHGLVHGGGATQVSFAFLAHASAQVAGTRLAMHRLSVGAQPKPFLGSFVCFLFWHVGSFRGLTTGGADFL